MTKTNIHNEQNKHVLSQTSTTNTSLSSRQRLPSSLLNPLERLESFDVREFDLMKPFLLTSIESMPSCRAD